MNVLFFFMVAPPEDGHLRLLLSLPVFAEYFAVVCVVAIAVVVLHGVVECPEHGLLVDLSNIDWLYLALDIQLEFCFLVLHVQALILVT